ncbi:MAG: bacterial Ig-like domain-containing protein [Clostridia bacterium]|nr:bacterial Ig-like domain-containing protein [Clostridia bacterium]
MKKYLALALALLLLTFAAFTACGKSGGESDRSADETGGGQGELEISDGVGDVPVVTELRIETMPEKTLYSVGDPLDTTGLTLTAVLSDGTTVPVLSDYTCSPEILGQDGTRTVTVTYKGVEASYDVIVEPSRILGVSVETMPDKMSYYVGETLDLSGITVRVEYANGNVVDYHEDVFPKRTFEKTGTMEVTLMIGSRKIPLTVTVRSRESTPARIEVATMPEKTRYAVGETFDKTGLTLTAVYDDGATETVSSGFLCAAESFDTPGTKTVAVTYWDKSTRLYVEVEPVWASIVSYPASLTCRVGETLNLDGLVVRTEGANGDVVMDENAFPVYRFDEPGNYVIPLVGDAVLEVTVIK